MTLCFSFLQSVSENPLAQSQGNVSTKYGECGSAFLDQCARIPTHLHPSHTATRGILQVFLSLHSVLHPSVTLSLLICLTVSAQVFRQCVSAPFPVRPVISWKLPVSCRSSSHVSRNVWKYRIRRRSRGWRQRWRSSGCGARKPVLAVGLPGWTCWGLSTPFWRLGVPLLVSVLTIHHKDYRLWLFWARLICFCQFYRSSCWKRDVMWEGGTARR